MRSRTLVATACAPLLAVLTSSHCSSAPTDTCATVAIDDFKELIIVDPAITGDPSQHQPPDTRAMNANDGPWSFRHVVESVAPEGADTSEFVRSWFLEWVNTTTFNGYPIDPPGESRVASMHERILCPWMQRTAGNDCNSDCSMCAVQPPKLDLAQAPFQLAAIVNRLDLRFQPDLSSSGEARMVFAAMDGAGDGVNSSPLGMTLIFEFGLPTSTSTHDWAKAWHALGAFTSYDDSFKTALATFTESWIGRGAAPEKPNGSALSQVRTNEDVLDWLWQQRQFELGSDGQLHVAGLRDTPPLDLPNEQAISAFILSNSSAVLNQTFAMPPALLGGSSDYLHPAQWSFPDITDGKLRSAFATNTCSGCHLQEQSSIDTAFHVSPYSKGVARLSTFVYNPRNRATDQLTVREASLRDALCGP